MATMYESMFKRQSIRSYTKQALDESFLDELEQFISTTATPLDKNIKMQFPLVTNKQVSSSMARNYILCYTESKENSLINAGFMMQQISLYLNTRQIGSCFLGLAKPREAYMPPKNMDYAIMMAIGHPKGELFRKPEDFKRFDIEKITNAQSEDQWMFEPSRLAPSAVNLQPTYYMMGHNTVDVYIDDRNTPLNLVTKKYKEIDLGISLYHAVLNLQEKNYKTNLYVNDSHRPLKGYKYKISLNFK